MTQKLHARKIIRIEEPDIESRSEICIRDAIGHAMMIIQNLLRGVELKPKDKMMVDIRILVESEDTDILQKDV